MHTNDPISGARIRALVLRLLMNNLLFYNLCRTGTARRSTRRDRRSLFLFGDGPICQDNIWLVKGAYHDLDHSDLCGAV